MINASSPHIHPKNSITQVMLQVVYAMLLGIGVYVYFFGWGVVINLAIAIVTALVAEVIVLRMRSKPIKPFILDGSALVTAMLLALALPNLAPWWLVFLGSAFAIIIAKHLYGGLGYNPFNPAMIGYAMLLIAFPLQMTQWLSPDHTLTFTDQLRYSLFNELPANLNLDGITMATTLDTVKTQLKLDTTYEAIEQSHGILFGKLAGFGWEWVNIAFLLGGLYLIYKRIISWHIPVAFLVSLTVMATVFYSTTSTSPLFHLLSGATMLGAFFIATDPVTASTTTKGRLIYAAGIGVLTYVIRMWGGYPDGVAFAVIIMNMAVPTIDYYTQPKVYGAR